MMFESLNHDYFTDKEFTKLPTRRWFCFVNAGKLSYVFMSFVIGAEKEKSNVRKLTHTLMSRHNLRQSYCFEPDIYNRNCMSVCVKLFRGGNTLG